MEEGVIPLSTIVGPSSDTFMDLDMDELLLGGCWLEANGSEFSQFDSLPPILPFGPSFSWPALDALNGEEINTGPSEDKESNTGPSKDNEDDRQQSSFPEENMYNPMTRPENDLIETRRWWIGSSYSISTVDRLIRALGYIKDRSRDKDVLIQVWVPVTREGKRVLTTHNQPFLLDLNFRRLVHYREISVNYQFIADEDSREAVGLPGRVFMNRGPEWTPDVRFFTWDEYHRVGHAQQFDVRGTLAVPVFEQGNQSCLGVIEVVFTTQKIQYRPELESVSEALKAVNFKSAYVSSTQKFETSDSSYQAALPEILDLVRSACQKHGLPLAQTWVPCNLQGKGGCWHSDENFKNCVSPVESACHIGDSRIQGFHEACSEYHLLKGQGIVGKAFGTNQPCFSTDVSAYSKTEYPLSHHARMFGLKAAVAIRLRSVLTCLNDFVLEFFLPTNCVGPEEQKKMLTSLSANIQDVCRTLRVVTDKELREEENSSEMDIITEVQFPRDFSDQVNCQESVGAVSMFQNGKLRETLAAASEIGLGQRPYSNSKEDFTFVANNSTCGDGSSLDTDRTGDKRRTKTEKTITLDVLRQHFAGSLKDAAKNLGVCPTTLKRVCRQHGIQRWPSRKIKKVGHSLQKIQRVIDSVQGALQIDSFYSNFPELNSLRTTHQFSNSESFDNEIPLDSHPPESSILRIPPLTTTSISPSSSCSQSSCSSQCCSSDAQPNSYTSLNVAHCEDPMVKDESDFNGTMERTKSDANLHGFNDGRKLLPRSQSHASFCGPTDQSETLQVAPEEKSRERDNPRIKVTYGEDMIRFRMQSNWGYNDLFREICRRFGVDDVDGLRLKYLDDDAEWVLLTCDDDLEECIDVCRLSGTQTIKLSFLPDT